MKMNAIEVINALNWIRKPTDYLVLLLRIKPLEATSTYSRILPNKAKLGLCHIVWLPDTSFFNYLSALSWR